MAKAQTIEITVGDSGFLLNANWHDGSNEIKTTTHYLSDKSDLAALFNQLLLDPSPHDPFPPSPPAPTP